MKTNENKVDIKKPIVVLYHGDIDGFGAAWAAWKVFGNKADYVEAKHQTPPPEGLTNKRIFFVDFCYDDKETMQKLLAENKEVVVIDHHLSNKGNAEVSTECVFDNNHSGVFLAWKYFHPKKKVPLLVRHIEDIDLWKFKMAGTKELMMALDAFEFEFKLWDKIAADFENSKKRRKYFEDGVAVSKFQDRMIEKNMEGGEDVTICGQEAFAVNSSGIDPSELGNLIVKRKKKIGLIWRYDKGRLKVSLRAGNKLNADVSKISAEFGGGGHKNSAGFSVIDPKIEFPWKKK